MRFDAFRCVKTHFDAFCKVILFFWCSLMHFDVILCVLTAHFDTFWRIPTHFDAFRPILTHFDAFRSVYLDSKVTFLKLFLHQLNVILYFDAFWYVLTRLDAFRRTSMHFVKTYLVKLFLGVPNVIFLFSLSRSKRIVVQIQIVAGTRQNFAPRHHRYWTKQMVFKIAEK